MKTTSIIISGAVASGKSTIARKLAEDIGYELINEETTGNYYKILDRIHPKHLPHAIYEHCWIYKKRYIFEALYERVVVVILDVSEDVLLQNYKKRKEIDASGDYLDIDPLKQQTQILSENPDTHIVQIQTYADYDKAYDTIKSLVK